MRRRAQGAAQRCTPLLARAPSRGSAHARRQACPGRREGRGPGAAPAVRRLSWACPVSPGHHRVCHAPLAAVPVCAVPRAIDGPRALYPQRLTLQQPATPTPCPTPLAHARMSRTSQRMTIRLPRVTYGGPPHQQMRCRRPTGGGVRRSIAASGCIACTGARHWCPQGVGTTALPRTPWWVAGSSARTKQD